MAISRGIVAGLAHSGVAALKGGLGHIAKWGTYIGLGGATVVAGSHAVNSVTGTNPNPVDPDASLLDRVRNPVDATKDVGQRGIEVAEMLEHFGKTFDAIVNPKQILISIASFVETVARMVGAHEFADQARDFYLSQQLYVKDLDVTRALYEENAYSNPELDPTNAHRMEASYNSSPDIGEGLLAGAAALGTGGFLANRLLTRNAAAGGTTTNAGGTNLSIQPANSTRAATLANVTDDAARAAIEGGSRPASSAAAGAVDDAARAVAQNENIFVRAWNAIPNKFKIWGLAGTAAVTGYAAVTQDATAAVNPTVDLSEAGFDLSNQGDYITATPEDLSGYEDMSTEGYAAFAAGGAALALKTGAKVIPVAGAAVYAGDTLSETWHYASNGDFGRAGLSLVAGTGLTLGGLGGGLTMGLGEAWHAAVRDGAIHMFGEDAAIGKSDLRQLGEIGFEVGQELLFGPAESHPTSQFNSAVAANGGQPLPVQTTTFNPNVGSAGISGPNANHNNDMQYAI